MRIGLAASTAGTEDGPTGPQPSAVSVHVSPDGDDRWPGTVQRPVHSLEAARAILRRTGGGRRPRTVLLRPGVHRRSTPFRLGPEDSGCSGAPVTYRAAEGGPVVLSGAVPLERSAFRPVTDAWTLNQIRSAAARRSVLELDIARFGGASAGRLWRHGFALATPLPPVALYVAGIRMRRARFPLRGWLQAGAAVHQAYFRNLGFRAARRPFWQRFVTALGAAFWPSALSDRFACDPDLLANLGAGHGLMLEGTLTRDWAWSFNHVLRTDADDGTVRLAFPERYRLPVNGGGRFAFDNVLACLALPGECWLDPSGARLLLVPPPEFSAPDAKIELAVLDGPMLDLRGSRDVAFSGLVLEHGRDLAARIEGGEGVSMEHCEIRGFGRGGLVLRGRRHHVRACRLHDLGGAAVVLAGGNGRTLEAGASVVEDCDIHDWAGWQKTYTPAVALEGLGNSVRHCRLHDGPHMAIEVRGNDHRIEANEIHDVVREFDDMGAIYVDQGKEPLSRGTMIQGNLVRDIGHGRAKVRGLYADRSTMGLTVEGNLFCRIGGGARSGAQAVGGNGFAYVRVRGNVFLDCTAPMVLDCWLAAWGRDALAEFERAWRRALLPGRMTPEHLRSYPELRDFACESHVLPPGNRFDRNLVLNPRTPLLVAQGHGTVNGPPTLIAAEGNEFAVGDMVTVARDGDVAVRLAGDVPWDKSVLIALASTCFGPRKPVGPSGVCDGSEESVEQGRGEPLLAVLLR